MLAQTKAVCSAAEKKTRQSQKAQALLHYLRHEDLVLLTLTSWVCSITATRKGT